MIVKRTRSSQESPFARADLAREIFSSNKEKLTLAPVFLKDGLLSEIHDRQKRRRASLRKWVSWTTSLGFGAFLLVISVRQSGLSVPLNVPVALEIPVPQVNQQKVARVQVAFSDGVIAPTPSPGSSLGRQINLELTEGNTAVWIPVIAQQSGSHYIQLNFYRQDGVLVASRTLSLKTNTGMPTTPQGRFLKSAPVAKVSSSLHAFALLLRPTLFTTKIVSYDDVQARNFRTHAENR